MGVLTFRFTDDMIMVAKKKRGRDASFFMSPGGAFPILSHRLCT